MERGGRGGEVERGGKKEERLHHLPGFVFLSSLGLSQ